MMQKTYLYLRMAKLRNNAIPYRLERFGVFIYKVLLWLSLGLVTGLFTTEMQGFISVWLLFVLIPGICWIYGP
ncbi:MAG TPA: hypothetical protein VKZ57_01070 [Sphingobacterium sp.]|nr:hypothetical protein [Sphingobacterium sp.]